MTPPASESREAFDELLELLRELADRYAGPEWLVQAPDDVAEALRRAGIETVTSAPDAASAARKLARDLHEPATVVVTGSFMHLSAARETLQGGRSAGPPRR